MNASRSSSKSESATKKNAGDLSELNFSFDESVLQLIDEPFDLKIDPANLRTDFKYNGFDSTMGGTWIYPTNYPVRQYQLHISRVSLYRNTLVSWLYFFFHFPPSFLITYFFHLGVFADWLG